MIEWKIENSFMSINLIDVLLAIVVVTIALNGFRRGFLRGSLDLLSWVLSFLAALRFYPSVAKWLGNQVPWNEVWNRPIAFILIGIVVGIIVEVVGSALIRVFS